MSGLATGNTSRATHAAVVDLTRMYLSERLDGLRSRQYSRRASDDLGNLEGDVLGIPHVRLDVTSRIRFALAEDLTNARRGADLDGSDIASFLQWRGRGIADAFVITSLEDFRKLLAGDHLRRP